LENQWAYPRALHGVFGHPHYDGNEEELTPIGFTLQHTDYKSVGAYRKFSGGNASNPMFGDVGQALLHDARESRVNRRCQPSSPE
jgi:hypothetical protein